MIIPRLQKEFTKIGDTRKFLNLQKNAAIKAIRKNPQISKEELEGVVEKVANNPRRKKLINNIAKSFKKNGDKMAEFTIGETTKSMADPKYQKVINKLME